MSPCIITANNYFYPRGGSENIFFSEIEYLRTAGWQVVPFSMHHPENYSSQWSEYFVEELEFQNIKSFGGKISAARKFIYSHEAKRKMRRLIERVNPNICHLHNIYHHLSPSILPEIKSHNIPVVMTLHDLKLACPAYTMLARDGICERCKGGQYRHVIKHRCISDSVIQSTLVYLEAQLHKFLDSYASNVDTFVVPSRFYKDKFIEWGLNGEQLEYIPNSIDPSRYSPNWESGSYFAYAGRLVEQKGVTTLIQAAHQAGVTLKIAGTGPLEHTLKQAVRDLNADVEFVGYLQGDNLHSFIANSRALVIPSEGYENAPISILEAYALGVPVIGARIGGIPELIHVSETGVLFEPGDQEALSTRLSQLSSMNHGQLTQMGRTARDLVESQYSDPLRFTRLMELYARLGVSTN